MTIEGRFDGEHLRVYLNGHRLRILWAVSALAWTVIVLDWRRGSGLPNMPSRRSRTTS